MVHVQATIPCEQDRAPETSVAGCKSCAKGATLISIIHNSAHRLRRRFTSCPANASEQDLANEDRLVRHWNVQNSKT
jgi:hypothetical protein